jgi:hypothetical protein
MAADRVSLWGFGYHARGGQPLHSSSSSLNGAMSDAAGCRFSRPENDGKSAS